MSKNRGYFQQDLRGLNCLQINLRHSKRASANLAQLLLDLNIDVALIQEPYASIINGTVTLANVPCKYTAFYELSKEHAYGAVILVNKTLKASKVQLASLCENHVIGVTIRSLSPAPTLFSIYCRPALASLWPILTPLSSIPKPTQ